MSLSNLIAVDRLCRLSLGVLLVALVCACWPSARAQAAPRQQRTDAFRSAPCMITLPPDVVEGQDVSCGYLTVPERHGEPDGPTIELAVVIINSTNPNPAPDPLVMLQGGPGGSTIDSFTETMLGSELRADRDIVLFDQRGTLYSNPALQCDETLDLLLRTIDQQLSDDEEERLYQEALAVCHARLVRQGIDLADFDSIENAADIAALRAALGYEQFNLYGVSYGTLLALHAMRDYADGLRSVILDAVVPTQTNYILQAPSSQNRAFNELFRACAADPSCNAAYPNLERVFYDLVQAWDAQPVRIPLTDPDTGTTYQAVADGDVLLDGLFQMLYVTQLIPALPTMIYDLRDGDYAFFGRIYALLLFDRTFSQGMYYSVICAEDADFQPEDVPLAGVRPKIAEDAERDAAAFVETCRAWDVPPLDPIVDVPVSSDIPTLVLNGRFDPITPPAFGEAAAQTLSRNYVFTFPNTGHGALTDSDCAIKIARAFLAAPQQTPQADCLDEQSAPTFITPANTLFAPSLQRLLAVLNGQNWLPVLVLLLSLVVLLTLFVVWPVALVVRLVRGRPADRRPWALAARMCMILIGMLGVVFVGGLIVAILRTEQANNIVLFFGLPSQYAPLLALPLVIVLLTLGALIGAVLAWRHSFWSVWGRLYYSLLTLAALSFVGIMTYWGLPGALFGW